jgi:hypothetical protein
LDLSAIKHLFYGPQINGRYLFSRLVNIFK